MSEEDFYDFLISWGEGVEILERGDVVTFALYQPVEGLKPIEVQEVKLQESKKAFKPIQVDSFLVCPPWIKPIIINPSVAFGTGQHPTTQICLQLIQDFYKKGWSAIDVGCGSGILSIALKKLGAKRVLAIDVDKNAVKECMENARLNGVKLRCIRAKPEEVKETFHFLVANLEIEIFRKNVESIKELFSKVGVFSGLYKKSELREFLKMVEDLKVVKIKRLKNWYGVVLEK